MWSLSLAFCAVSFASSAVERPSVVRREVGAERSDPSQLRRSKAPPAHVASQPRQGQRIHVTRIHPAEVTAWNFLEIDQQKQRFIGTPESPEDEPDDSETDQDEVSGESGRADFDVEEAEERSVSDDAEAAGENGEGEASEDPGASLLSRPEKMEKSQKSQKGQKMNVSKEIRMKQGLEHNTSTENDGEDGDRFENSSKTGIERTEKSARASNESKLDAESNASLKSQNGTKLSTGNESMATESVEAPVGRNRHRQNESEESQGDDSTEKNATIQARSENDTVAEAEEELRKLQDALRTAERRAAKAEADLQAEKAWVSNALRNYSEEAAPHHEKKMSHEALADLAQVLMSFENRDIRDAAKKPQDGTKLEDGADEEGVGNAIEESIREENARQRMRHKYVNKDKAEDGPDRTYGTDEDSDGSSVTEESSEERETSQLQKHKPWHKHKSHKHKKGGFHVYVEADGGLLEQSSRKVPHE